MIQREEYFEFWKNPVFIIGAGLLFIFVLFRILFPVGIPEPGKDQNIYSLPIKSIDGENFSLDPQTRRTLVIKFWSTTCKVCLDDLPILEAQIREHKNTAVELVLVNLDIDKEEVHKFLIGRQIYYPTYFADGNLAMSQFEIYGLPCTIIFDKEGYSVQKYYGNVSGDMVETALKKAGF